MINKVILVGNVGADPDVKYIKENQPVAHVSFATTETFMKNNERTSTTEWHRLVFWGNLAKLVEDYVVKGTQLYIEGRIHYGQYQDKNNETRYTTDIVVSEMKFLGGAKSKQGKVGKSEEENKSDLNSLVNGNSVNTPF